MPNEELLHVTHVGPSPSDIGGMESVLRVYERARWSQLSISVLPSTSRARRLDKIRLVARAVRILRKGSDGPVHVHLSQRGSFVREGLISVVAGKSRPVFATIHGSDFVATAHGFKWRWLYGRILRRMRGIAVLNESALATARALAPEVPVCILANPGSDAILPVSPRSSHRVVFAGEVGYRKGVDVLVKAWSKVREAVPDAQLDILGPIGDLDGVTLEAAAPYLRGSATPEEVSGYLGRASCAVLPSRAEGQPMFLIEALGHGLPIVATEVGGMPGLASGSGLVVAVGAVDDLAAAIITVLTQEAVADRYAAHALERYLNEFSPSAHERGLMRLYDGASAHD